MEKKLSSSVDLYSILRDILRQWWVILITGLAVSLLANVYVTATYEPVYKTQTTFAVSSKSAGSSVYTNLSSAKDLAERFTQVLDSNILQKTVMEDLDMTTFNAETSAQQVPETNLVVLTVSSDSAMDSYRILTSIMNNYEVVSDYLLGSVVLEVIQEPTVPMHVANALNTRTPMKRGFLIGAALMLLFVAWCSYKRDTVKNESQMKEKIDADLLGIIYHEAKIDRIAGGTAGAKLKNIFSGRENKNSKKVSMLLNNPMRSFFFVEANRMMASRIRSKMDRRDAQIVMVTSVMENEGKSTVAANIALGIAQEGRKVLLVDADFRKPSQYKIFEIEAKDRVNFVDFLKHRSEYDGNPDRTFEDTSLSVIANTKPSRNAAALIDSDKLHGLLSEYRLEMDYIVLDTAPMALVSDTEIMAGIADCAVIVVREDQVPARAINDAIDTLNRAGTRVLGCVYSNALRRKTAGQHSANKNYGGYYGKRKE